MFKKEKTMTDFNYNDVIEYVDDTFDENFEAAKKWAREHNTTLDELIDRRTERDGVLYRYFQIGEEPKPYIPTDEEKAAIIRRKRDVLIDDIKWRIERYKSQQELEIETSDNATTYTQILRYMQYLRDIPVQEDFPNMELLTFEQWQETLSD